VLARMNLLLVIGLPGVLVDGHATPLTTKRLTNAFYIQSPRLQNVPVPGIL